MRQAITSSSYILFCIEQQVVRSTLHYVLVGLALLFAKVNYLRFF